MDKNEVIKRIERLRSVGISLISMSEQLDLFAKSFSDRITLKLEQQQSPDDLKKEVLELNSIYEHRLTAIKMRINSLQDNWYNLTLALLNSDKENIDDGILGNLSDDLYGADA